MRQPRLCGFALPPMAFRSCYGYPTACFTGDSRGVTMTTAVLPRANSDTDRLYVYMAYICALIAAHINFEINQRLTLLL